MKGLVMSFDAYPPSAGVCNHHSDCLAPTVAEWTDSNTHLNGVALVGVGGYVGQGRRMELSRDTHHRTTEHATCCA